MGCDIHFYVERRVNHIWTTCDAWEKADVPYGKAFYNGRNYDLFAILANVRNGFGFAGCDTGEGFFPIAMPRGLPDDCCPEYRSAAEDYGSDGHSHSWLTLAELMAFDWTQMTRKRGWVPLQEYCFVRLGYDPRNWCGAISGQSVRLHEANEVEAAAKELDRYELNRDCSTIAEKLGGKHLSHHVNYEWEWPYYRCANDFLGIVIPRLWRLGSPEDVRCVFFFDN